MQRFFLNPTHIGEKTVTFPENISHQLRHVLRTRSGDQVIVLDNLGNEYDVVLQVSDGRKIGGQITAKRAAKGEPDIILTLMLCLSQREKFEWMLQKCTELGAARFVPVISSRSLVQADKNNAKKLIRWERILTEAAEQSGRGQVPILHPPLKLEQAARLDLPETALRIIPDVRAGSMPLKQVLAEQVSDHTPRQIAALIGPEGGFSAEEVEHAVQTGFIPVTLGKRVLRMETAAVAVSALVMYHFGQME